MTYTQAVALYVLGFAVFVLLVGGLTALAFRWGRAAVDRINAREAAREPPRRSRPPTRNTEPPP